MKITGIETFHLSSPLERPFGWSQGWIDHRSVNLVKVSTDEGSSDGERARAWM